MHKGMGIAFAVAVSVLLGCGAANAAGDTIKISFFATLEGTYTSLGEDGQHGFDLALQQHHNMAGGKKLEIIRGSSDASPDSALRSARKLVEEDKVDILIAPLVDCGTARDSAHRRRRLSPQIDLHPARHAGWVGFFCAGASLGRHSANALPRCACGAA
jgi:Periplasmic binding protein